MRADLGFKQYGEIPVRAVSVGITGALLFTMVLISALAIIHRAEERPLHPSPYMLALRYAAALWLGIYLVRQVKKPDRFAVAD